MSCAHCNKILRTIVIMGNNVVVLKFKATTSSYERAKVTLIYHNFNTPLSRASTAPMRQYHLSLTLRIFIHYHSYNFVSSILTATVGAYIVLQHDLN